MRLKATYSKLLLEFKRPAGTSRGVLTHKTSWIIRVWDADQPDIFGLGECSVIPGLSPDYTTDEIYEKQLEILCSELDNHLESTEKLSAWPSIRFGVETALLDLKNGGKQLWFPTEFTKGKRNIPINGLIWMGDENFMHEQIEQKLADGFSCIKMKVGALNFNTELKLLTSIRKRFDASKIVLRVDANGAFSPKDVLDRLEELAKLDIHSIEQPIRQGQLTEMKQLCQATPLPIALDEELIGVNTFNDKRNLLELIQPQYIILKPSLIGGLQSAREWIEIAKSLNIPWWITSALESNLGLNAIAQFTATYENQLPQGLGTGGLYTSNLNAPLYIKNGELIYQQD